MEKLLMKYYFFRFMLNKILRKIFNQQKTTYVWSRIDDYRDIWTKAAEQSGSEITEVRNGLWKISRNDQSTMVSIYRVELDNPVILTMAGNKPLIYQYLSENKLPIAKYLVFKSSELEKMRQFIDATNGMFVVKPASGTSSGIGVTTHLKTYEECRRAAALASINGSELIIEQLVPGEIYRLLCVGGKMVNASRRRGLWLTGDGQSSILELLIQHYREQGVSVRNPIDRDLESTLQAQNLGYADVLEDARSILCKTFINHQSDKEEIRTVYTDDVTSHICDDIRDMAERACRTIGTKFAGVDIITLDPARPLGETGGVIGELNTTPGMHHHQNLEGHDSNNQSAGAAVLDYIFTHNA